MDLEYWNRRGKRLVILVFGLSIVILFLALVLFQPNQPTMMQVVDKLGNRLTIASQQTSDQLPEEPGPKEEHAFVESSRDPEVEDADRDSQKVTKVELEVEQDTVVHKDREHDSIEVDESDASIDSYTVPSTVKADVPSNEIIAETEQEGEEDSDQSENVDTEDQPGTSEEQVPDVTSPEGQDEDPVESGEWASKRKELFENHVPKKVLLITYMSGGSAMGGQMFNMNQDAIYWSEPLDAFYMAYYGLGVGNFPERILLRNNTGEKKMEIDPTERKLLTDFFVSLYSCRYEDLPSLSWLHPFTPMSRSSVMQHLKSCALSDQLTVTIKNCGQLVSVCGHYLEDSLRLHCPQLILEARRLAAEQPRMSPNELGSKLAEYLLQHQEVSQELASNVMTIAEHELCVTRMHQDNLGCLHEACEMCQHAGVQVAKVNRINMEEVEHLLKAVPDLHVLHYFRDPRRIIASRVKANTDFDNVVHEARTLCTRMAADLELRRSLEDQYPGVFLQLRYEDLVADPRAMGEQVYSFIGEKVADGWNSYSKFLVRDDDSLSKIKHVFDEEELKVVNKECELLLSDLGYVSK